jgi:hypothetical protein
MAGTSMAAPHVSGIAALVASVAPTPLSPTGLRTRILTRGAALAPTAGKTVTGRLANAWRSIDVTGPVALPVNRHGINVGSIVGSSVSTTLVWPAATDDMSGVASYALRRRLGSGPWSTVASGLTVRSAKQPLTFGTLTRFGVSARDGVGNVGAPADAPAVRAVLLQDGTSLAQYDGIWSTVTSTTASNGKLHATTRTGASVEFRTTARAIGIVARKRPGNGQAKVYVDGAYVQTIDLNGTTTQARVVVFNRSWPTNGVHTVKLVAVGTAGRPRVEIDAFAILR